MLRIIRRLPEDVLKTGLINFAAYPPEDDSFITTRMWDKYLPRWRAFKDEPKKPRDPEEDKRTIEEMKRMSDRRSFSRSMRAAHGYVDYVALQRSIWPQKGKWLRFSEDQINRMRERGEIK